MISSANSTVTEIAGCRLSRTSLRAVWYTKLQFVTENVGGYIPGLPFPEKRTSSREVINCFYSDVSLLAIISEALALSEC